MRVFLFIMAALCALASPAAAQGPRDFAGTWAFRTDQYGPASLSGAAVIQHARRGGAFTIRLMAQEQNLETGTITSVAQNCTGLATGGQLSITCELAEEMQNYAPDNFELSLTGPGRMEGVLQSASNAQALFVRVR